MERRSGFARTGPRRGVRPLLVLLAATVLVAGPTLLPSTAGGGGDRATTDWEELSNGLPTSGTFFGVAFGHIDGDGAMDLVASSDGDGLLAFLGDGEGRWRPVGDHPATGGGFSGVCLADFDGDGHTDLFAGSPGVEATEPAGIHVYRGDGSGGFEDVTSSTGLPTTGSWRGVTAGDVNGDGRMDLAATSGYGSSDGIHVFVGDGAGGFTDQSSGLPGKQDRDSNVVLADFDKDGDVDLAAGGRPGTDVYLGNGGRGGSMVWTQSSVGLPRTRSTGISAADVDDDGLVDLVISSVEAGISGGIFAYQNVREASVWTSISTGLPSGDFVENSVGDFNGDGSLDIAATGGFESSYGIQLYEGDGDGTWTERSPGLPSDAYYVGLDTGDFDGDGSPDIVAGKRTDGGGVEVWRNPRGAPDPTIPRVRLGSPLGGESWTGGSTHDISWTASRGTPPYSVTIRYSTNGGTTFSGVIASGLSQTDAGPMTHEWTVPSEDLPHVRVSVEITDVASKTHNDYSVTDVEIDSTAPRVVTTDPPDGAVGVAIDPLVRITFSEGMGPAAADAVSISGPGDPTLAPVGWSGNTLSLQAAGLAYETSYSVRVSTGAVDDSNPGNALDGEHGTSFETRSQPKSDPPVAVVAGDVVVDQHEAAVLDGTGSTDDVAVEDWTWSWQYGGQTVSLRGASLTFTFDLAGVYLVTLTVTDGDDQTTAATMRVLVNDIEEPVADAGDDVTIDQHGTTALDGRGSTDNVGIASFHWTFSYDGTTITNSSPSFAFRFDEVGVYDVTLTVEDEARNEGAASLRVTVRDAEPPVPVPGRNLTVEEGARAVFDGQASWDNVGIVGWNWTIELRSGAVTLEGPTASYRFHERGRYRVTLTVVDGAGLSSSGELFVRVEEEPSGPPWTMVAVLASIVVAIAIGLMLRRPRPIEVSSTGEDGDGT